MAGNGNPKGLLIAVGGLVVIGAAVSVYMLKSNTDSETVAPIETTASTEIVGDSATAPAEPTAVSEPAEAAAPGKVDLAVDANGLSKSTVMMKTDKGVIKFKFYSKDAPNTVNRIVELIQKGFYNGLGFHRVVPGFVVQGGDPKGDGTGGSGQNLNAEFNSRKHVPGAVAMARAQDPNSADSQFYISLGTHPHLDNNYTVFGMVVEGMDVVEKIAVGDKMNTVTIQ